MTFTGILASCTHAQAAQLVEEHGGISTDHVSRQLTMLVIGEEGWPLEDNGQPSVKFQQVERWIQSGAQIQILNESQWLTLLGLNDYRGEVHRLYTPAMLSSVFGISVHMVRGWERCGLIRPHRRVFRLPYFDFREVSSARRLSELLESGIPHAEIQDSLKRLPSVRRGDERPLEQLDILAHRSQILIRDPHGLVQAASGQRLLDFDGVARQKPKPPVEATDEPSSIRLNLVTETVEGSERSTNRDWLIEGCRLYDAGRVADALTAFRRAAMASPLSADVHFQLGECLYRMHHLEGALERYYVAIEHDPDFLEAWTQIGCLQNEMGNLQLSQKAFETALQILPEYPDAHYHLAETLSQLGELEVARQHWIEYLKHDHRGPWADVARDRLEALGDPLAN